MCDPLLSQVLFERTPAVLQVDWTAGWAGVVLSSTVLAAAFGHTAGATQALCWTCLLGTPVAQPKSFFSRGPVPPHGRTSDKTQAVVGSMQGMMVVGLHYAARVGC
jgi:hypothetical protein